MASEDAVQKLFNPSSVAVIGASRHPGKVGNAVVKNLLRGGYKGKIYPVNPKATEILGLRSYSSIKDINNPVDLAVITVPNKLVPGVMEQLGEKKVSTAIIISAGFKETGGKGVELEREVVRIAKKHGIRFLGPNCFGVIDTWNNLNTTFGNQNPYRGYISFISQSGALCISILNKGITEKIGFSKFINLGNKGDIDEADLLEHLNNDPKTRVITFYLEDVRNGKRFMEKASEVVKNKPILAIKSGRTEEGGRAVSSHTGSLAGLDRSYETAFKQCGVIRVYRIDELFDAAEAFATQPLPKDDKVGILTNGGGVGVLLTDAVASLGMKLTSFEKKTIKVLNKFLPPFASFRNPLDVTGNANEQIYFSAFKTLLSDRNISSLITAVLPIQILDAKKLAEMLGKGLKETGKTVIGCFMGGGEVEEIEDVLREYGIPNFTEPERAAKALSTLIKYKSLLEETGKGKIVKFNVNKERVQVILKKARGEGRTRLTEIEAKEILKSYGIPIPKYKVVKTVEQALEAANEIGYPVVLKIVSPEILHKTDIGAVKVNITDEKELRNAYLQIVMNVRKYAPGSTIKGVSVQEMVPSGTEVIIGGTMDPQFGSLVMFGLGGIYVEVFKDVSFRVVPVTDWEASKMITEIKGYDLLRGVRGKEGVDIDFIKENILRISQLLSDFPEIIELDVNPIIVYPKLGFAVDARILFSA